MSKQHRLETQLIHAGEPRPRIRGAAVLPIFQSTVFEAESGLGYDDILYPRLNNLPNQAALGAKLAAIEDAEHGLVTASGMAAISATLMTSLPAGSHLLAQRGLYGGTHSFVTENLPAMGVTVDFVDSAAPETWAERLQSNTRAFYVETISNPLLKIPALDAVVAFCREHGLASIIDNTFASPMGFKPIPFGFDISVHSATKYLNGHSDIAAGAVIGSRSGVEAIRHTLNHLGGSLDPHACFLLQRGLKTLSLRVERQCANALALAEFLSRQAEVGKVYYPGLHNDSEHTRATRYLQRCGGVVSFEFGPDGDTAQRLVESVELPVPGPSLGGVETLITRPAATSHAGLNDDELAAAGIAKNLIRLAVGIEAVEDLTDDFSRAITACTSEAQAVT